MKMEMKSDITPAQATHDQLNSIRYGELTRYANLGQFRKHGDSRGKDKRNKRKPNSAGTMLR